MRRRRPWRTTSWSSSTNTRIWAMTPLCTIQASPWPPAWRSRNAYTSAPRRRGTTRSAAARGRARGRRRWATRGAAQRVARPGSGCRQHAGSGQRDSRRVEVSRPRNHFAAPNGTPTVIENPPRRRRARLGRAPERALGRVGVLVVLRGPVPPRERRARSPLAAHDLALDGSGPVGGEPDARRCCTP